MAKATRIRIPVLWEREKSALSDGDAQNFQDWMKSERADLYSAAEDPDVTGFVLGWQGLSHLATRYLSGGWLFRGESRFDYVLRPTIGRPDLRRDATDTDVHPPYKLRDERWILDQFMLRSRPYLHHQPAGLLEWLAIAQHHGLPTRLLDWTESFLVAAYFATTSAGRHRVPAAVYAIPILPAAKGKDDPFAMDRIRFYRPPHISPNIQAQTGVFTVHPRPMKVFRPARFEKWLIDWRDCFNIKKHLDVCGINHSSLFPGIDGLAQYFKWRYKWPKSRMMA